MQPTNEYRLPEINYLIFKFQLAALEDSGLPLSKGPMLRGAFGSALRSTVCSMKSPQECFRCLLRSKCTYTQIFETFISDKPPRFLKGLDTAPRPFVIDCSNQQWQFRKGEILEFTMTVIGNAISYIPFIVYAVHRMGERGLGARRKPFFLRSAEYQNSRGEWTQLYDGIRQKLLPIPQTQETPSGVAEEGIQWVHIEFVTPTRLKFRNEYSMEFNFRMLLFKMVRRILELAYFYQPDAQIDWEFHSLLVAANKVEILFSSLHWVDIERYSNRQRTTLKLGGFVGKLTLQGKMTPFLPVLYASEVLHVGKGTTFGLGKIRVDTKKTDGE